ncbi:UNVERIFIED_CONTAM: Clp protease N-terminal domain-containing protein, partial [Kocuria sp. CPCC 205295]|uniref:Clp protease N-terminal domain-containing protein n=1 Tax=Kocuria sp. CPCC 205295 TaxID=3073557 RepID=UPI0036D7A8C2
MSARTMPIFLMAGWREAVRAREPYIDLDHLLIGLIAAGGPAAKALAQHGLTLNSARTAASAVHAEVKRPGFGSELPEGESDHAQEVHPR